MGPGVLGRCCLASGACTRGTCRSGHTSRSPTGRWTWCIGAAPPSTGWVLQPRPRVDAPRRCPRSGRTHRLQPSPGSRGVQEPARGGPAMDSAQVSIGDSHDTIAPDISWNLTPSVREQGSTHRPLRVGFALRPRLTRLPRYRTMPTTGQSRPGSSDTEGHPIAPAGAAEVKRSLLRHRPHIRGPELEVVHGVAGRYAPSEECYGHSTRPVRRLHQRPFDTAHQERSTR